MPTRLLSHTFKKGAECPINAQFSKVHGPNPGTASITFKARKPVGNEFNVISELYGFLAPMLQATLGSDMTITCDTSEFIGNVVNRTVNADDSSGLEIYTLELVDWRDRLHDFFIFGAFNMLDDNGKSWHLLPKHWKKQIRTYISKELDQFDFDALQEENTKSGQIEIISKKKLISSATILNIICDYYNLEWTAVEAIKTQLQKTRPMNIDWQNGVNGANAIESVLSKSNMVWTIKGKNKIVIHQKGVSKNLFFDLFLSGLQTMCTLDGRKSSRGDEINEEGRNILIVGERNKHQFTFPCRPDWNYDKWDFRLCFDGWSLSALLKENEVFPWSKLKELPKEYRDDRPWDKNAEGFAEGNLTTERTRNEMKISDYVSKICFKAYRIDFGNVIKGLDEFNIENVDYSKAKVHTLNKNNLKRFDEEDVHDPLGHDLDFETWIGRYPWYEQLHPLDPSIIPLYEGDEPVLVYDYNTFFPISQNIVSDSNTQFIALKSSRKILKGKKYPFEEQRFFVPTNSGTSIESFEEIDPKKGKLSYGARLIFNTVQYIIDDLEDWRNPDKIKPDKMLCVLSLDKDIYTHEQGSRAGVRVRTQKKQVKNLYRAYIDGKEVIVLAQNYQRDLKKGGAVPAAKPVKAKDVAKKISEQLLYHMAVTKTGTMTFHDKASHSPDGTIESVNVSWNDKTGLTENISFSHTYSLDSEEQLPLSVYRVSREVMTESKINRETLESIGKAVIKNAEKHGTAGETRDEMFQSYGAGATVNHLQHIMNGGVDDQNTVVANVDLASFPQVEEALNSCDIVVMSGPNKIEVE